MRRNELSLVVSGIAAIAVGLGSTACSQVSSNAAQRPARLQGDAAAKNPSGRRPIALVYRGPAACDGCAEAAADMVKRQPQHFVVEYIGPREKLHFSKKVLAGAALYVQPGGGDDMDAAWAELKKDKAFSGKVIQDFIRNGGRYLGLCMGGFLAGSTDDGAGGYQILPGDSQDYVTSAGADVRTQQDTLVKVTWYGAGKPATRKMYFQAGPYFQLNRPSAKGITVLARYENRGKDKRIAMMVTPYGRGKVGVSGPHPEATPDWYSDSGLPSLYTANTDIGNALVARLMG